MGVDSRMLDIIRKIGEVTPPPVRLSKLFESPEQDFFSFSIPTAELSALATVFHVLALSSVNIRFLGEHLGGDGDLRVQMCVDSVQGALALKAIQGEDVAGVIGEWNHRPRAVILSLYPFNGQPHIAGRIFDTMHAEGIEILGAGSATSVFSCVILRNKAGLAISKLKSAFVLP